MRFRLRLPLVPGRLRDRGADQRRLLRQAVREAEFAVLAAQTVGAPVGELATLCHRLRLAAREADRALSGSPSARPPAAGIADLLNAARLIQHGAAAAIAAAG